MDVVITVHTDGTWNSSVKEVHRYEEAKRTAATADTG